MGHDEPPQSLDELDARLRKAREKIDGGRQGTGSSDDLPQNSIGAAFRIGVELLSAMIVGVGGGLLIDHWLGTSPWGLILMFFMGAGAGIMNVYRAVKGLGYAPGYRHDDTPGDHTR